MSFVVEYVAWIVCPAHQYGFHITRTLEKKQDTVCSIYDLRAPSCHYARFLASIHYI